MTTGKRIKEERERLGLNQTDFAAEGGVGRKSQFNYEEDERRPDADYLSAIAAVGADVLYIITGQRSSTRPPPLKSDEQVLLDGYRSLDAMTKRRALAFMLTESGPIAVQKKIKETTPKGSVIVTASGIGNQAAGRKITNQRKK